MNDWNFWFATGLASLDKGVIDSERLLDEGRVERWGHRAVIHHRDNADELYVVVKGGIEVDRDTSVRLRDGDLFGMTKPDGSPTFRAYDETTIVALDREHFQELVDDNGLVLSTRLRKGMRLSQLAIQLPLDAIVGVTPTGRLARVFDKVAVTNGEHEGDRAVLPNLKPRHLSNLSALDRDSTRRAFNALIDASLIESPAGALVVPSVSALGRFIEDES